MKSRISFFDRTLFRKNLTRFAPVWGLYTLYHLLNVLFLFGMGSFHVDMAGSVDGMSFVNFAYALICAVLLFGDLFKPRLCNAIHALPVRRETLYVTNLLSGISFSLFPTLVALLISLTVTSTNVENAILAPLLFYAVSNLQFLFFFGVAALSAMLVGSRLAAVLIYGLINFASGIVLWIVESLYIPMLYGVQADDSLFSLLFPLLEMMDHEYILNSWTEIGAQVQYTLQVGEGWGYLAVCAAIGIGFMALGLLLYRRRKLECAGDFLAFRKCEPVFLVIFTVVAGVFLHTVSSLFFGAFQFFLLFLGMTVGFFCGLMLLRRTVRVFRLKAFGLCGALLLVMIATLEVTRLDPMGIVEWMPETEEVESVTLYDSHYLNKGRSRTITLEDPEDIENILKAHRDVLEQYREFEETEGSVFTVLNSVQPSFDEFTLEYKLKDGTQVCRYYYCWEDSLAMDIQLGYFNSAECILGVEENEIAELAALITYIDGENRQVYDQQEILRFLEAVVADSNAGTLTQSRYDYLTDAEHLQYLYCTVIQNGQIVERIGIRVTTDNENILKWMERNYVPIAETENYK